MRWLSFILGALLVLTLQSVVAPRVEVFGARPDWLLVYVLFFALYGRRLHAVVGAWGLGAAADLMTVERPIQSLSYAVAALLVVGVREHLFRYEATAQVAVALIAGLLVRSGWLVLRWMVEPRFLVSMDVVLVEVGVASMYTALFAPLLYRVLLRAPELFGVQRRRYGLGRGAEPQT